MTKSIKPPSSIGTPVVTELPKSNETSRADFRADLVTTPDIPSVRETTPSVSRTVSTGTAVTRALADELRAGRITPSEAVEAMVQGALASPMAKRLGPEALARLESVVREQLANDPALSALIGDLDRGR